MLMRNSLDHTEVQILHGFIKKLTNSNDAGEMSDSQSVLIGANDLFLR